MEDLEASMPKVAEPHHSSRSLKNALGDAELSFRLSALKFSRLFDCLKPSEETKKTWYYRTFHEVCLTSSMPNAQKYLYKRGFKQKQQGYYILLCIDVVLRGVAQVFLCNHPLAGILITIGLGLTSYQLSLYALLGTAVATFSAVTVARPPEEDILAGLCGYDGALVGCACLSYFAGYRESATATILLSFLAGVVHVSVTNLMKIWTLPSFTFAFNIVTIMIVYAVSSHNIHMRFKPSSTHHYPDDWTSMSGGFVLDASVRGVGQFMFADTTEGGVLILAGIALCSRKGAIIALLGSIVGWVTAFYILDVTNRVGIRQGIFGYNSAGCCCALAGGIFYKVHDGAILVGVVGAFLAALLHQGIAGAFGGLPVLTFPFIISAWIMMLCRSKWLSETSEGFLKPLMRKMSTQTILGRPASMSRMGTFSRSPSMNRAGSFNRATSLQRWPSLSSLKQKQKQWTPQKTKARVNVTNSSMESMDKGLDGHVEEMGSPAIGLPMEVYVFQDTFEAASDEGDPENRGRGANWRAEFSPQLEDIVEEASDVDQRSRAQSRKSVISDDNMIVEDTKES